MEVNRNRFCFNYISDILIPGNTSRLPRVSAKRTVSRLVLPFCFKQP
jgi:hypothetical protein